MRIAFDLDDTLIETTIQFEVGTEENPWWCRYFFREKLRQGTRELLKEFQRHHEIWIYTNSLRSILGLKLWFWVLGIALDRIINLDVHNAMVKQQQIERPFSKMPSLFGIDLLIDDSHGVYSECRQQKCGCILVESCDPRWDERLKNRVLVGRFILLGMTRNVETKSVILNCFTEQGSRQFLIKFGMIGASLPGELEYLVTHTLPRSRKFDEILFPFYQGEEFEFPIDLSEL